MGEQKKSTKKGRKEKKGGKKNGNGRITHLVSVKKSY